MEKENDNELRSFRLDMKIEKMEIIDEDKDKAYVQFEIVPDPKIWEFKELNGVKGYLNKKTHFFISQETLKKSAPSLVGKPVYGPPPDHGSEEEYIKKIKKRLEQEQK